MELFVAGVDEEFMPWLVAEVSQEIESIITSRDVITGKPFSRIHALLFCDDENVVVYLSISKCFC